MIKSTSTDAVVAAAGTASAGWISTVDAGSLEAAVALAVGGLTILLLILRIGIAWRELNERKP